MRVVSPPKLEAYHFHEQEWESLEQLRDAFEWQVPEQFNIASYCCDRWATRRNTIAVFSENDSMSETVTFWELRNRSNQLANYLASRGLESGDRVAVNLPQRPEALIAHFAILKLGAVSVPLSTLYGKKGLSHRLDDSGVRGCFVDERNVTDIRAARQTVPSLEQLYVLDDVEPKAGEVAVIDAMASESREFTTAETDPEDPAFIFYTSGTTGSPKGVVHAHHQLLGLLPYHMLTVRNLERCPEDLVWTPSEWSWAGVLCSQVLPTLFYGDPVLACDIGRFDPDRSLQLIEEYGITISMFPPTALRMLRTEGAADRYDVEALRLISSGGESVGENLREWADEAFSGIVLHEGYGQTEVIGIVGDCAALQPPREGAMGVVSPGSDIAILDADDLSPVEHSVTGEISLRYEGHPGCFTEYWNRTKETEEKIRDGWLLTEDLGRVDEDGYVYFEGRKDDVIISSGYRIGPGEVEDALADHEAVFEAGVIGIPHDERGQVPKAFVALAEEYDDTDEQVEQLQSYVKGELAAYEYPREIEFVDDLPKTSTDGLRRVELRRWEGLEE